MSATTQCTYPLASVSTTTRAKATVPWGTWLQARGGDTSAPLQV